MLRAHPAGDMSLGRIKGNAFREFLVWFEERSGKEALDRAWRELPPEHRALLDPNRPALGVLPSSWYAVAAVHSLLDELTAGFTDAERDRFAEQAAAATIGRMMRGLQKTAFSLLVSPRRYPKIINTLWRMSYDTGSVRVVEHSPTCHEGIVSGWAGHHPLICKINHLSKQHMYATMGCKDVRVELTSCLVRGDADCRSFVRWR